ncbi:MAG: Asp-tRNA(Asn)/Glu-tRNA(Gln) amidotransferase subunit GatA [Acutalibacteraceae bacterium]
MDITKMTALEIGKAIKSKAFTSVEAVTAFLDKIRETDRELNAYITVCAQEAIQRAKSVQEKINKGETTSPLAGVPVSIKDNICTNAVKTSCASKILGDFTPVYNATVMDKAEEAGLIMLGKLNMDEFAMGSTTETSFYGPVKNPWDISCSPGGSSGGAAAAVAAGEAAIALGSDSDGGIRQPAAHCSVTGFKPTYGAVSRNGLSAYASSFDQIGPIAKDVADCAAMTDIICGKDPLDGTSLDIKHPGYLNSLTDDVRGMRIGFYNECLEDGAGTDVARLIGDASKIFEEMGSTVEEIGLPFLNYVVPVNYIIACAQASSNLSRFDGIKYGFRSKEYNGVNDLYSATRGEGFGDEVKKRIIFGTFVLSSGYYDAFYNKALRVRALIKEQLDEIFSKYDLIICPVTEKSASKLGESLRANSKMYKEDIFTAAANIGGLPALSVPCGLDKRNMPVGMQLIGQRLDDVTVLSAGYAFQQRTVFHKLTAGGDSR